MPDETVVTPAAPETPVAPEPTPTATMQTSVPQAETPAPEPTLEEKYPATLAVEDLGQLKKKFTITIPAERVKAKLDDQFKQLKDTAAVPGFRIGRAPMRLIEKRFGGDLRQDVRNALIGQAYQEVTAGKQEIKIVGEPEYPNLDAITLPAEGPLVFSVEAEVEPEFKLPELTGIPVEKPKVTVSDEMVNGELERMRANMGRWVVPTDDPTIHPDDHLLCRVVMKAGEKTVEHPSVALPARGTSIESAPLPELGEKLKGCKLGDTVEIAGAMPPDAENEFKGQAVQFTITINEIRRQQLPEMNQDFVSTFGFSTLDELNKFLRERMELQVQDMQNQFLRGKIAEYLLKNTEMEVPPNLSLRQANRSLLRQIVRLRSNGVPDAQVEKQIDELRTGAVRQASNDLKQFFILQKIADERKIEVSEEELNTEIARIARQYNRRFDRAREELARDGSLSFLAVQIRENKTLDSLLKDAVVTEVEPNPAEPAAVSSST